MLFVSILVSILLDVRALNRPGPEPGAGELDLLPGQLLEADGDAFHQIESYTKRNF